ncbi:extracellular solute-binding protein [Microbacterium rhizosphaerae]|uniref:Extracellular solute-binding protein n=1 Tax=Microbacterium rhizosphaerae TaxID=1678237 RepID=A0ABZ0SN66_9MICO|nr:extracellular solute-binding protein [Microbacterium rhizosphaerae]WPR89659.1 extracellular solute-binding protein [Microbacterium rhizosphaerae]
MNKKRLVSAFAAGLVLIAGLTACSGNSAAPTKSSSAAAASGNLVIYTGSGPEVTTPLLAAFAKQYPDIHVQIVNAGSGELLARITAEANNPGGDIFLGASPASFSSAPQLFQAYKSKGDAGEVQQDPQNLWHGWDIMPQAILVNTQLLPDKSSWPKTLADLTSSKWSGGKIAFADPTKSGTGQSIVRGMVAAHGWNYISDLAPNLTVLPGSDAMFDAVKGGTQPVGFINEDLGTKWEQAGVPVKMIFPKDGTTNALDAFGIIKGSKDLANAKHFVDFLTSKSGGEVTVNKILRRSTLNGSPTPAGLAKISTFKLIDTSKIATEDVATKFTDTVAEARK